jgi:hypothetical protein
MFEQSEEQMNASSSLINKNTMKVTDILLEADSPEDLKRKRDEIKRRREEREAKSKEAEANAEAKRKETAASADADRRAEVRKDRKADVVKKQYQKDNPVKSRVRAIFGKPFDPKTAGKDLVSQLEARRSQYKNVIKPAAKMAKFAKFIKFTGILGVGLVEYWDWLDDDRAATLYYKNGAITKRQYDYLVEYYKWRGLKVIIPIAAGKLLTGFISIMTVMGAAALRLIGVAAVAIPGAGWIGAAASVIAMFGVEYLMQTDWFKNSVEKYFFNWLAELAMGVSEQDSADIAQDIRTQLSAETGKAQARFRELMLKAEAAN